MRILQVTSDYLPKPLWGMGWHVNQLVNALKANNIDVSVATAYKSHDFHPNIITTSAETDSEYLSDKDYEIFNDFNKFNIWQEKLAEKILATHEKFNIVHCHNWMSWLTAKKLKEYDNDIKTVITFHFLQKQYELMAENPIPTFHKDIIDIELDAIKNANHVIVLSDSQEQLIKNGYSNIGNKLSLIPHSVNFNTHEYSEIKKAKNENPYLDILFVGRVENDKGITETLEAFNNIPKSSKNIRLNIVGDGPLLKKLSEKYTDPRIIYHGYLQREELQELLMKGHIFCMPSTSENLPLTVLEAMFFGVVPVFSKGKTVPTIFKENEEGLNVPLHLKGSKYVTDPKEITEKLTRLLDDKQLRENLSHNTYLQANRNFSSKYMANEIIRLYKSL